MKVPNPTEKIDVSHFRAEEPPHRNLFCPRYDGCLNVAVQAGWADFTCAQCPLQHATPTPSAAVYAQDRPKE